MENVEQTQPTAQEQVQEQAQEAPKVTLLSAISYTNREDYEAFLANLSGEHAIVALIAAANHAQARGAFNLDEAELVAKAIRKLTVPTQPANAPATAEAAAPAAPKKATRSRKK